MIRRILYYTAAAGLLLLLGMQFDRPAKNDSNDQSKHFSTQFPIPDSVETILRAACYDCHSNSTRYPWYAEIQPIGIWMDGHIREGKKEINFSEFAAYRPRRQYHKMEEVQEMVQDSLMPLPSYLRMHGDAVLTEVQKNTLFAWVSTTRDSMRNFYHPDSLRARKRSQ
jgi:hypothetical protein